MRGNSHVQFLGGPLSVRIGGYPTWSSYFWVQSGDRFREARVVLWIYRGAFLGVERLREKRAGYPKPGCERLCERLCSSVAGGTAARVARQGQAEKRSARRKLARYRLSGFGTVADYRRRRAIAETGRCDAAADRGWRAVSV